MRESLFHFRQFYCYKRSNCVNGVSCYWTRSSSLMCLFSGRVFPLEAWILEGSCEEILKPFPISGTQHREEPCYRVWFGVRKQLLRRFKLLTRSKRPKSLAGWKLDPRSLSYCGLCAWDSRTNQFESCAHVPFTYTDYGQGRIILWCSERCIARKWSLDRTR